MKLNVVADIKHVKGGIEARSPDLMLTAQGRDEDDALLSLKRGIIAWCSGLKSMGILEEILKSYELHYEGEDNIFDVNLVQSPIN